MSAESASGHLPLILIEGVLFFGGALAFGWWQLRSIARDQAETRRKREAEAAAEAKAAETAAATAQGPTDDAADPAADRQRAGPQPPPAAG